MATLTISLKKIILGVKFAERTSALLQNNNVSKKNSAFCSVLQDNPAVASPKEQLYEQMTSNPASTERNIQKPNASLLDCRPEQKSLVTYHTLRSLYVCVWLVNTLTSTAPIGSPIICMWSPADICEQWERNLSFGSADVRGAGTRDEPLRTSAWEDRRTGDEVSEDFGATTSSNTLNFNFGKQHQWLSINILSSNSQVFLQLSDA